MLHVVLPKAAKRSAYSIVLPILSSDAPYELLLFRQLLNATTELLITCNTRVKGKPNNKTSKDKLNNKFKALLVNTINNKYNKVIGSYFTIIKSLFILLAILISIINALINNLTSYSLLY